MGYKVINSVGFDKTEDIIKLFAKENISAKGGNNSCAIVEFEGNNYAVLKTSNIECYKTQELESDEFYAEILRKQDLKLKQVMDLTHKHACHNAVPILGFAYDEDNILKFDKCAYAKGFIVQPKAMGTELYKDVKSTFVESYNENILRYTKQYSTIPPEHFSKFLLNYFEISKDIMIDPSKTTNFFYDEKIGFSFIDLNFKSNKQYLLEDCARNILVQFRFRVKEGELNKQVIQSFKEDFVKLYRNIYLGFLESGLDDEKIKSVFLTQFSPEEFEKIKGNALEKQ